MPDEAAPHRDTPHPEQLPKPKALGEILGPTAARPPKNAAAGPLAAGDTDRDDGAGRNGNRIDETARTPADLGIPDDPYILSAAYQAYRLRRGALDLAGWMTICLKRHAQGLSIGSAALQVTRCAVSLAGFLVWNKVKFEQRGWMAQAHEGTHAALDMVRRMPEVLDRVRRIPEMVDRAYCVGSTELDSELDFPHREAIRLALRYCSVWAAETWFDIATSFPEWLDWPDDSEVLRRAKGEWRRMHGIEGLPTTSPLPQVNHSDPSPRSVVPLAVDPAAAGSPSEQNPDGAGPPGDDRVDDSKNTNARVKDELGRNPHATSQEIAKKVGRSSQTVRRTKAWREHQALLNPQKPKSTDAMDHARPLSAPMLAVIGSGAADPADIAADREELDDSEALDPIEARRRRFLETATPGQRARLNSLSPGEQAHELEAWDRTGMFLPDDPPSPGPLRRRMAGRRPD